MKYIFGLSKPFDRYISITLELGGPFPAEEVILQLPSWRPGRYELGNFAKNVKGFKAIDDSGQELQSMKISRDSWMIKGPSKNIKVEYKYYAAQPDAGACWTDHEVMYVNPVHCCMFVPGRMDEECVVKLEIPDYWKTATSLKKTGGQTFSAANYHELVDSPFIASPALQHATYTEGGVNFNIWIQGGCEPDWVRIIKDFEGFTKIQLNTMKNFPSGEFHFLVLVLPYTFYHGVEHLSSTVLAIGPGYNLMKPALYNEFVGVASHELFHCWNVKTIRPVEMMPYDYSKENYSTLGYVYEGITTYYGDLFLGRSGFFSLHQLLDEYSGRLQKHMDNPGRYNYSVAESSFDTWLDGYVPGVPGRKTSIYDEGCLLALAMDFIIRSATESKNSLDDVMRSMYENYGRKGKGYSREDFQKLLENISGRSFKDFFTHYVYKAASLESLLAEVVSLAGIGIHKVPSGAFQERRLGIKTELRKGNTFVTNVYPESPAALEGITRDDEIISVNNIRVDNNISELVEIAGKDDMILELFTSSNRRTVAIKPTEQEYYSKFNFYPMDQIPSSQLMFREKWIGG